MNPGDDPIDWGAATWIGRPVDDMPEAEPVDKSDDRPDIVRALMPPTYLRKTFVLPGQATRATLSATALGVYEIFINGTRVGDHVLAPGWTDYRRRVHAQQFDVSALLGPGKNVISAVIADGWYSGYVGFDRGHQARLWGASPRLLARLTACLASGGRIAEETDGSWRWSTGKFVYADLQMGEMQDMTREPAGWQTVDFDDSGWSVPDIELPVDPPMIERSPAPPIRTVHTVRPERVQQLDGRYIVDFGQNLVGVVSLRLRDASPGRRIRIRHGEAVTTQGRLYTENLRSALAEDVYVCGGGDETFRPRFTFHGFRYVEILGWPGELDGSELSALVLHSDVPRLGTFESSESGLNRLHSNIEWTIRGNLLDVPTDCPQRDERLGWLADAQLIMPTAAFVRDLDGFLAKWAVDIRDSQSPSGEFPDVAPKASLYQAGAPGWADAGVLVPWTAYLHYGSLGRLDSSYRSMSRWIARVVEANPTGLRSRGLNRNYGDWLNLDAPTPKALLATAYFAYSVETMRKAALALGEQEDADDYGRLWRKIKAAFISEYVSDDGRVLGDTQTGYAMALHLDLVPAHLRENSAERLVAAIRSTGHLSTGIHGTRFLLPALTETAHHGVACELALRTDFPSWLYTVQNGATTVWERWDGWTPHEGFQDPRMNSFNHYALGSVAEWFHRYLVGINPVREGPAFQRTVIRPCPGPGVEWASATRRVSGDELRVRWEKRDASLDLSVRIPEGTTSAVYVPTGDGSVEIQRAASDPEIQAAGSDAPGWRMHVLRHGEYRFRAPFDESWAPAPFVSTDRLAL